VGIKGTDIIPVIYNYVFSVSPPYFPEIPAFTRIKTAIIGSNKTIKKVTATSLNSLLNDQRLYSKNKFICH